MTTNIYQDGQSKSVMMGQQIYDWTTDIHQGGERKSPGLKRALYADLQASSPTTNFPCFLKRTY